MGSTLFIYEIQSTAEVQNSRCVILRYREQCAGGISCENRDFTLKMRHMFSVHTTPKEFKNATLASHLGFVFEENSVRKNTRLS